MKVSVVETGPHKVIRLEGELDLMTIDRLKRVLNDELYDGLRSFIIDMAGVSYLDSSGLGTLVGCNKRMKQNGGQFFLVNLNEHVMKVLHLSSLDLFFNISSGSDDDYAYIPHPDLLKKTDREQTPDNDGAVGTETGDRDSASGGSAGAYLEEKHEDITMLHSQPEKHGDRIIFKGWVDGDTFRIGGRGTARDSVKNELQRKVEAKNNAVYNARLLALDHFVLYCKSSHFRAFVDYQQKVYHAFSEIVNSGTVLLTSFDDNHNCSIILEIKADNLHQRVRSTVKASKG